MERYVSRSIKKSFCTFLQECIMYFILYEITISIYLFFSLHRLPLVSEIHTLPKLRENDRYPMSKGVSYCSLFGKPKRTGDSKKFTTKIYFYINCEINHNILKVYLYFKYKL